MTFLAMTIAAAQGPGRPAQGQSDFFLPVWIGLMLLIFYFMMIKPQQRKEKERKAMMESIKSGDRVVFGGGILGIVTNVKDKTFTIKVADNVKIEVSRGAVTEVLEKGEKPADAEK